MVDQRAVDYIKTNLSNGFPLEQIKKALEDAGWPQEEINNAVEFINKGYQETVSKGKNTKKILLISLAILLVSCVILGFLLYPKEIGFGKELINAIDFKSDSKEIFIEDNEIIDCGQSADLGTFPDMEIILKGGGKMETKYFESDSALKCFGNNLFKCTKAKVVLNDDENGIRNLEIKGKNGSNCLIVQEFGDINSSPFEYLSNGKLECLIHIDDMPTIYFIISEPEDEKMIGLPAQAAVGVSIAMMLDHLFDTGGICKFESKNEGDVETDLVIDYGSDKYCFFENLEQCKPAKYKISFMECTIKGLQGDKCKIHSLVNANVMGEGYETKGTYYECLVQKKFLNENYSIWESEQLNSRSDSCKGTFIDALNQQIMDKTTMFVYMGKTIRLVGIGSDQKVSVEVDGVFGVVGLSEERVINGLRVKNLEILNGGNAVKLQFSLN